MPAQSPLAPGSETELLRALELHLPGLVLLDRDLEIVRGAAKGHAAALVGRAAGRELVLIEELSGPNEKSVLRALELAALVREHAGELLARFECDRGPRRGRARSSSRRSRRPRACWPNSSGSGSARRRSPRARRSAARACAGATRADRCAAWRAATAAWRGGWRAWTRRSSSRTRPRDADSSMPSWRCTWSAFRTEWKVLRNPRAARLSIRASRCSPRPRSRPSTSA